MSLTAFSRAWLLVVPRMTGTVVRGGYGLFSALNQGSTYYAMRVENGVVQLNYNYSGCKSSWARPLVLPDLRRPEQVAISRTSLTCPPARRSPARSTRLAARSRPSIVPATPSSVTASTDSIRTSFRPLRTKMNLCVEQSLPGKLSLSVGYVGTRGMRLPVFLDAQLIGQKPSGEPATRAGRQQQHYQAR